jgi:hypothetical protein
MGGLDDHIGAAEEAARARQDDAVRHNQLLSEKREEIHRLIEDFLNRMETAGNPGLAELEPNPHAPRAWRLAERQDVVTPTGELLVYMWSAPNYSGNSYSHVTGFPWSDIGRVEALDVDALGAALARKLVEHDAHRLVPGPGIRREQWKARAQGEFLRLIPHAGYYSALVAPVISHEGASPMLRHWLVGTFEELRSDPTGGYRTENAYFCEDETLRATAIHTYKPRFRDYKHIMGLGQPRADLVPAHVVTESLLRIAEDAGLDLGLMPVQRRA